jgi:hypothetical protein
LNLKNPVTTQSFNEIINLTKFLQGREVESGREGRAGERHLSTRRPEFVFSFAPAR